jgi:HlyD family secretion protein
VKTHLSQIALVFLAAAAGCGQKPTEQQATGQAPPDKKPDPTTVALVKPKRSAIRQVIALPGRVEAWEFTPIFAKVPGYAEKVHVDIDDRIVGPTYDDKGRKVKQGTLLAEVSVPEMIDQLNQKVALVDQAAEEIEQAREIVNVADANLRATEAPVKEAEAGRGRAEALVERWQLEYQRIAAQTRGGVVDPQTRDETAYQLASTKAGRDEVEAKVQSAKAAVKEAEAKLRKARADVKVATARHKAVQAERDNAATLLQYTRLEAPYSGVVIKRNVNTGDFLLPAAGGSKGEPLFVVAQMDVMRIFVEVPETEAVFIAKGVPARIRVRSLPGEEFEGRVARTAWALQGQGRTLLTEINVKNPEGKLRHGTYAFATITVEHPNAWVLPASAVMTENEQAVCYRVVNGKAVRTPLRTGLRDGKSVEVLQMQTGDGKWQDVVGAEEIVAAAGQVKDGQEVQVKRE